MSRLVLRSALLAIATLAGCDDTLVAEPAPAVIVAPTICGATDESQYVNDYDGTLGPTRTFVDINKRPVGALEYTGVDGSSKYCSGTLIARDLFLTAGHCVDRKTVGHFVSFQYERAANSSALLPQSHYRVTAVVEDGRKLDYAIIRLANNPGDTWGVTPVATADATPGEELTIIGHPEGKPKMIEAGTLSNADADRLYYGDIDTLGGNSGSGILDADGYLVGVHTNGGCTATGGANSGSKISRIRALSAVL